MIVEIRADTSRADPPDRPAPAPETDDTLSLLEADTLPEPVSSSPRRAILTALAILTIVAWIGGLSWALRQTLPTLSIAEFVALAPAYCSVPALVGIGWLIALRSSRAEAMRFGLTARAMRAEAAALERTVAILSATIDDDRRRLAEQVSALMELGNAAHQRLSALGTGLADEIAQAEGHARTLATAAATTQAEVGTLIASLPRAHQETEQVRQILEHTGMSAMQQAVGLHAEIVALAVRGQEADAIANGAADRLAAHIVRMEATSETAGARLEAVTSAMSSSVDALLGRTADAIDESRKGLAAQGDAMLAMVGANQAALDSAARDSAEALAARIATVDAAIERLAGRLETQRIAGGAIVEELHDGIAQVETRIDALHAQGVDRSQLLAASISALGGSANAMTGALETGDAVARRTIATTETLLIALDAAAREIDETLPDALTRLDAKIAGSKQVVVQAKPELLALVTAAESTHDAIEAIAGVIAEQRRTLDHLSGTLLDTLTAGRTKADALGQMVDETIARTHRFAEEAAPRLVEALLRVRDTATVAADRARETLAGVIPEAADALEAASAEAMRRATSDTVERQVRAIADATHVAVDAATRATERLAGHVQTIADQSALIETRFEDQRVEREAADRDTFARRVSLLIEALNSASIDIAKVFASDVSDSAWAAYLKGDRGVFTRRAVRIVDAAEVREIVRLYDDDAAFREQVNRYIHDFEAMLRTILAQRDGSPLGVTLLSSDMGKLYVALAQAIERLR